MLPYTKNHSDSKEMNGNKKKCRYMIANGYYDLYLLAVPNQRSYR